MRVDFTISETPIRGWGVVLKRRILVKVNVFESQEGI